jgi:hypothetical protein
LTGRRIDDALDEGGKLVEGVGFLPPTATMSVINPLDARNGMAEDPFGDVGPHTGARHQ